MNANGRPEGDIPNVVRVIGPERARLARMDDNCLLIGTMFLKNAGRYDEGACGFTVVMEAGGLPGQPADHPDVVIRPGKKPLIPALFGAEPHSVYPSF